MQKYIDKTSLRAASVMVASAVCFFFVFYGISGFKTGWVVGWVVFLAGWMFWWCKVLKEGKKYWDSIKDKPQPLELK